MPNQLELLRELSIEARDLSLGDHVQTIDFPFGALNFYRDYVAASKPVIIKGALDQSIPLQKWSNQYLETKLGKCKVTVAVTPNGLADAVACTTSPGEQPTACFALPLKERMPFTDFLSRLTSKGGPDAEVARRSLQVTEPVGPCSPREVLYIQEQNGNMLSEEFSPLHADIPELPWAEEIFGNQPDAVNLWIGSDESITTFHRDHYENLYGVVAGHKLFTLLPPCDAYRMALQEYPVAEYERGADGSLQLVLQKGETSVGWSPIDPCPPDSHQAMHDFPLYFDPGLPAPLEVVLGPGDMLYLPAMWFHHVRQQADDERRVIAINWWHDMRWDIRAAYAHLIDRMSVQSPHAT